MANVVNYCFQHNSDTQLSVDGSQLTNTRLCLDIFSGTNSSPFKDEEHVKEVRAVQNKGRVSVLFLSLFVSPPPSSPGTRSLCKDMT